MIPLPCGTVPDETCPELNVQIHTQLPWVTLKTPKKRACHLGATRVAWNWLQNHTCIHLMGMLYMLIISFRYWWIGIKQGVTTSSFFLDAKMETCIFNFHIHFKIVTRVCVCPIMHLKNFIYHIDRLLISHWIRFNQECVWVIFLYYSTFPPPFGHGLLFHSSTSGPVFV